MLVLLWEFYVGFTWKSFEILSALGLFVCRLINSDCVLFETSCCILSGTMCFIREQFELVGCFFFTELRKVSFFMHKDIKPIYEHVKFHLKFYFNCTFYYSCFTLYRNFNFIKNRTFLYRHQHESVHTAIQLFKVCSWITVWKMTYEPHLCATYDFYFSLTVLKKSIQACATKCKRYIVNLTQLFESSANHIWTLRFIQFPFYGRLSVYFSNK